MHDFEALVEQYTPMIHHSMNRLRIYKNKDEFFQLGLIALWEANERFNHEKGDFTPYVYSYIRGRMLQELNRNTAFEEHFVHPEETYWHYLQGDSDVEIDLRILLKDLTELNKQQKKWVIYTFQEGLTVREIAERENVSQSAVKKWRQSAKEILKQTLNDVI